MRFSPDVPLRRIVVDGVALHYQQVGSGAPVLLVHGSLCDCRYWQAQMAPLAREARVIAPSLRHYWPAAAPQAGEFSVARHADDMARLIAQLDLGPMHVVGHSRGARVALELGLRHPHQVRSLVLADPSAHLTDAATLPVSLAVQRAQAALDVADTEAALAGFVDAVNGENTWARMVEGFKRMARDNAGTLPLQIREPVIGLDAAALAACTLPTLLVGGAAGPARYAVAQDLLQAHLPNTQRVVIDGAAHGMNLAKPHSFNTAVRDFLRHAGTA